MPYSALSAFTPIRSSSLALSFALSLPTTTFYPSSYPSTPATPFTTPITSPPKSSPPGPYITKPTTATLSVVLSNNNSAPCVVFNDPQLPDCPISGPSAQLGTLE